MVVLVYGSCYDGSDCCDYYGYWDDDTGGESDGSIYDDGTRSESPAPCCDWLVSVFVLSHTLLYKWEDIGY